MPRYSPAALVLLSTLGGVIHAQQPDAARPTYQLRMNQAQPGSLDRSPMASNAPYPLDKRYEQFTETEKNTLRSFYEGMPATDDPPFPLSGMKGVIADLGKIATLQQSEGDITIFVAVNEQGEATSAKLLKYPSLEIAQAVAFVLIKTKYKPARCSGQPCPQDFPFRFRLTSQ
ncbi:hypothetical protein ACPOLB_23340 [Rubrivivax sp. RP6-9]|uniref:hypothetical protein n=1 Tax=Rubrivivax sp. RP6-9 TaxID=3415750 RepID=UPI003CC5A03A